MATVTIPPTVTDTVSRAAKTAVHAAIAAFGSSTLHVTPLNGLESVAVAGGAAGVSVLWNASKHAAVAWVAAHDARVIAAAKALAAAGGA